MKAKTAITISAATLAILAGVFAIHPEFLTSSAFPEADAYAMGVGVSMRQSMAGMLLMTALVLFFARNVETVKDQSSVLLGTALGFTVMCATIIALPVIHDIPLESPPAVATGLMAAMCYWTRSKLA
jgi:hypothetical protein